MLTIILNKFLSTFLTKYKTAMYKTAKVCNSVRFLELEVTYTQSTVFLWVEISLL